MNIAETVEKDWCIAFGTVQMHMLQITTGPIVS